MADGWTWSFTDARGLSLEAADHDALTTTAFPTQAEAEAWLGESWPDLAGAGVAAVTLQRDGEDVYGPMSLAPPEASGGSGGSGGSW